MVAEWSKALSQIQVRSHTRGRKGRKSKKKKEAEIKKIVSTIGHKKEPSWLLSFLDTKKVEEFPSMID